MYVTFLAHHRYDCAVDVLVILQTESSTSPPASPSRFRLSSPSTRGIIMFSSVSCRLCCLAFDLRRLIFQRSSFLTWSGTLAVISDNMEVRYCSNERVVLPLFLRISRLHYSFHLHLFLGIYRAFCVVSLLSRALSVHLMFCLFCVSWMIGA